MRFMMLMIPRGYESAEPGTMPDAKDIEPMMAYNRELQDFPADARDTLDVEGFETMQHSGGAR
jgi:hypothetical protein